MVGNGLLVNTACSGLDSVFFGHSLVPFLVMRKTKEYCEIDETYFNRIFESLKTNPILLVVNKSSNAAASPLKMTAKMFVKM